MTTLLRKALSEIEKLPDAQQDAIAARLLAEVEDERAWSSRFSETTEAQWQAIAEDVRREVEAGRTEPIETLFSSESDES